jgi:hypothetical protein
VEWRSGIRKTATVSVFISSKPVFTIVNKLVFFQKKNDRSIKSDQIFWFSVSAVFVTLVETRSPTLDSQPHGCNPGMSDFSDLMIITLIVS